jgi:DNA-binding response OmpR family regulator
MKYRGQTVALEGLSENTVMNSQQSRLLIVDDNEMNRDMLARRLARNGYLVDVAENAQQLTHRVKENSIDLVLLDIEMPEVSGFDALKALRHDYSPSQLPVIMVTARSQREDILKALNLGANDYLTKPIDLSVALARIGSQLSQRRAQVAPAGDKRPTESDPPARRYIPRFPFAADAEIVDLKSGTRVNGVTSDLSLAGCFVCMRSSVEIGTRVRLTLARKDRKVTMLAEVRVVKPGAGIGIEFLDVAPDSNQILLAWTENLREAR